MDKIILIYGFMWEHLQKDTGVESMLSLVVNV